MQLYFKKYGESGKPILILHGLFGMSDNWHSMAKRLAENHLVYAIDLRNHGQSPHSNQMSFSLMADDIWELSQLEKLNDFILIGHSMGGKVAMMFAYKYTNFVKKLLVVDIAPKAYQKTHRKYFEALKNMNFYASSRSEIEKDLELNISDKGEILFLLKNLVRDDQGHFKLKLNLEAIENNYSNIIGSINQDWHRHQIETPTLFMKGENSGYITSEDEDLIHQQFSNVKIIEIKNAGHWIHADNPDDFYSKTIEFIA
jgi:esterase